MIGMVMLRPAVSWPSLLAGWSQVQVLSGKAGRIARKLAVVRQFIFSSGIAEPGLLSSAAVEEFLAREMRAGKSAKTVKNYASDISTFCKFLVKRGVLARGACLDIERPRPQKPPFYPLNWAEEKRALRLAVEHGIFCEVCLCLNSGLRMTELRLLEWTDILWSDKLILVRNAKNRRIRYVSMNRRAFGALSLALRTRTRLVHNRPILVRPGRYVFGSSYRPSQPRGVDWWSEALDPLRAAIPKFTLAGPKSTGRGWHNLRHTYGTRCARMGMTPFEIIKELGHSSLAMVMRYVELADGYNPAVERI